MKIKKKNIFRRVFCGFIAAAVLFSSSPAMAAEYEDYYEEAPIVTATPTPDPHTEYYNQAPDTDSIKECPLFSWI